MTKKNSWLFWPVVALVVLAALFVAVAGGARSAVGRHYDMEEAKLASPYQQSLALREQVMDNGKSDGRLLWLALVALGVIGAGWLLGRFAPAAREARLTVKAARRGRQAPRSRAQAGAPPALPQAPRAPLLTASVAEDGVYEDPAAPADRGRLSVGRVTGGSG